MELAANVSTIVFGVLSIFLLASALCVVSARNPVHSVLFLILAFFNAAGLFVLVGAEYLAMTLVVVYVGAVAVLFLFVVMMLNVNFEKLRAGFLSYLPLGGLVALIIFLEMAMMIYASVTSGTPVTQPQFATPLATELHNTKAIGMILYTDYFILFQLAGVILLIAMIGAIVLTLRQRPGVRRQDISKQVMRTRDESIVLVDVTTGEGA